jgi:hypothetical protein
MSFQKDFLIFFVFRAWKSIADRLSLIKRNITQLFVEVRLTISDFNFKRERSLLIQRIGNEAGNFKLAIMSDRLELIGVL